MKEAHGTATIVRHGKRPGVHVAVVLDATSEHHLWSDLTMSVDRGGVFVATYQHLPLGTVVDLELTLSDDEPPITAKGVVRWTRGHSDVSTAGAGVGIKLVDVATDVTERLDRFALMVREPMLFELEEAPMRRRRSSASSPPPA